MTDRIEWRYLPSPKVGLLDWWTLELSPGFYARIYHNPIEPTYRVQCAGERVASYPTLEEAKAACLATFRTRLTAALAQLDQLEAAEGVEG